MLKSAPKNFDSSAIEELFKNAPLAKKVIEFLSDFNMNPVEARTFLYLSKHGSSSAPTIMKSLGISKTDMYRIISNLQKRGLITGSFGHPVVYSAIPIKESMELLLNAEKDRLIDLQTKKRKILEIWNSLPEIDVLKNEDNDRFQILYGQSQITHTVLSMLSRAQSNVSLIAEENQLRILHHANAFSKLKKSKVKLRVLSSSKKSRAAYFMKGLKNYGVEKTSQSLSDQQFLVIRDDEEFLVVVKNKNSKKEIIAIWSESSLLINSMVLLFNLLWFDAKSRASDKDFSSKKGKYDFKMKELEQENIILFTLNKILDKKSNNNKQN